MPAEEPGVSLNMPTFLGSATLDSNYGVLGQTLVDGTSGSEVDTPLSTTPGYQLGFAGAQYDITTITGAQYGFTSLNNITGAIRIRGGGVFALTFAPDTNLFNSVNFQDLTVASLYGDQGTNQSIQATQATFVPEPRGAELCALTILFLVLKRPFIPCSKYVSSGDSARCELHASR